MAEEVEVSTETVPQNPDDDDNEDDADDEEDDEEVDEEVEDPEWHEETAIQVFVHRDLRARLSRSTLHAFSQARPEI